MATYRMTYGDDDDHLTETFENVEVVVEDGWVVIFRGAEAIMRMQQSHVHHLEEVQSGQS